MASQKCWDCGKRFNVLDDEVGDHRCPNPLCPSHSNDEDEQD